MDTQRFQKTEFPGLVVFQAKIFRDPRGYFFEPFNARLFAENGLPTDFVQDNQSLSAKGIVRGLHFQQPPHAQGKLIRVARGKVLDVVVDIRKGSPTYGKHYKIELSEENLLALYVPAGFAHGFLTLEDNTLFTYKCTDYYAPETEAGLLWNDPELNIDWGMEDVLLSDKDRDHSHFAEFDSPFKFQK